MSKSTGGGGNGGRKGKGGGGSGLSPEVEEAVKIHTQIDALKQNLQTIENMRGETSEQRKTIRDQTKEYKRQISTLQSKVDNPAMRKTTVVETVNGQRNWVEYIGPERAAGSKRTVLGRSIPGKYGPNWA